MDETKEEANGNIQLDPFVQPPILEKLFEQVWPEDLQTSRLVSKLWYNLSLSTWRSKTTLKFRRKEIVSTRSDGSTRTTSLGEFLDLWEAGEWGSRPFKKFYLLSWNFKAGEVEQERFLELVGGHVTSLNLVYCSFVGQDNFRKIIYQTFPKLQFLEMKSCDVDGARYCYESVEEILVYKEPAFGVHGLKSLDISLCLPDSMMDMLSHFHKVKSLRLLVEGRGQGYYREYRDLLETIRLIRTQGQTKLPLKNFNFDELEVDGLSPASSIELVKLHEQLNLPFQRLKIHFDPEEDDIWKLNDVFRDILKDHSSALKYLGVTGEQKDQHGLFCSFLFGFRLESLEELAINSPCLTDNLNYLRCTPTLRVLDIEDVSLSMSDSDILFSNSTQLEFGDWTLPTLKVLIFDAPLSPCNLEKLMKWMPNVEQLLGVQLDDVKFSMVCNSWKNLEVLADAGREITDEGIIGSENVNDSGGDEESQIAPNITQLKKLTTFWTYSSQLTSASVHDGFLKLANLQRLSLGDLSKLDDDAKAALEKRKITLCISSDDSD